MAQDNMCQIGGCGRVASLKNLCRKHYQRLKNTGTTAEPDLHSRFWKKCLISDSGCWEWQGYKNPAGYGQFSDGTKVMLTHRWTYREFVGELVDTLEIDHLCRNVSCCNPEHLEQVDRDENMRRTIGLKFNNYAKGDRTHCKRGHAMTPENSYKRPDRVNSYACRKCHVMYTQNWVDRQESTNV